MGDTEAAAAAFKISLELCLKAMPTIKVMALLGLSGLARIDALPKNCLRSNPRCGALRPSLIPIILQSVQGPV